MRGMCWSMRALAALAVLVAVMEAGTPPAACQARDSGAVLQCRATGLRSLPPLLPTVLVLDVSNNNISELPRNALQPATGLRDLNLSLNRLERVGAGALGGAALARLWLDRCALRRLPAHALRPLPHLHYLVSDSILFYVGFTSGFTRRDPTEEWISTVALRLFSYRKSYSRMNTLAYVVLLMEALPKSAEDNLITEVEADALSSARALRTVRLARNLLRAVPSHALAPLHHLQYLTLAGNLLSELSDSSLPPLPALHTLVLKRNRITHIDARAFANTPNLRVLRLEENLLTEVPPAIQLLPLLEDLSVASNRVEEVSASAVSGCRRLARLELRANPLTRLHRHALAHLPHLTTLVLSEARGLRALPALNGSTRLRTLRAEHARLAALPRDLCASAPQLRSLEVRGNYLDRVPDLHECSELRVLDLSSNQVPALEADALLGLRRLHDLLLAGNRLRRLTSDAFRHTPDLQVLNLEDNQIEHIDTETFVPISKLEDLNVGNNVFPWLPAAGLQRLLHLKAHNNPHLRHFHPPELFPRIQTLVLSYAYHCCEFMPLMQGNAGAGAGAGAGGSEEEEEEEEEAPTDFVIVPGAGAGADLAAWTNVTDIWGHLNLSGSTDGRLAALLEAWGAAGGARGAAGGARGAARGRGRVQCLPLPGPFLPCVDLFDWWTLRCGVWCVFLLALLGNGTVVFVLVSSRSRMDVPRFLVTNLAAADFCMGAYLGLLAVVDAGTLGEFRAHAVAWQMSPACRLAGFLGVLSSELSVYTLAVITLERNYAITHAMHLNKRLSLRHAACVMAAGWALALTAAALPLLGVSDYRKFAVCLPFETSSPGALAYVVALLAVNGLAFLVLLGCYLKMYCAIRGSQAWNSNDSRIARRMALLVFTDFLCWSPVAFFALTAAAGARLVSLEQAKVFTVFVLPLNSCCNPFLYAILTKQFKKDCALVCKAIEESRVTRGIGRCRHSSNFSNRQTPANTNSLNERSSGRQHGATCACRRLLPAPAVAPAGSAATVAGPPRLVRWWRACGRRRRRGDAAAPLAAGGAVTLAPRRAGSVSSSVEFSSSRSDSWRAYRGAPPPPRRAASWLIARKTSQDSNLSSSRNDSSGSAATASTGTWRTSRSVPAPAAAAAAAAAAAVGSRPRLTRQPALCSEDPPATPLGARALHTIPSAAEAELQQEESEPR